MYVQKFILSCKEPHLLSANLGGWIVDKAKYVDWLPCRIYLMPNKNIFSIKCLTEGLQFQQTLRVKGYTLNS